ncbi:hypothetical protein LCGC14_0929610 [marine sediment metagenome]|uniref:Uncharacterized protein n=1 Tax=marine sediment metagenome TaxID=412755 RepID=A0A0F9NND5_9ZZZZ
MAGQNITLAVTVEYAGAQSTARTAQLTSALGTPDSNSDVGGTWTTVWNAIPFSVNPSTQALMEFFDGVIAVMPSGVTVTMVFAA